MIESLFTDWSAEVVAAEMDTRNEASVRLAESLGCDFREIAIEDIVTAFHSALGGLEGLSAENLQARIRGTMLMALSNTHGWLVLATGNKSELSVGYSTLYGDLAGGFALIKDVYKTDVFRLVLHLNERAGRELVPASIIERAPSARPSFGTSRHHAAAATTTVGTTTRSCVPDRGRI